ncbi:hypothetical protein JCM17846_26900 [Iodidimonas nitroreducens]|uniref:AB hydrolase-1 domain-containing protein n=1 Tax=Iodidimonas nitroreducens TaxID=1236968 RepID=A0A5A7NA87_9PROT|nr:alpha/beta fold hydrolase [Iodidimonas nitroreducens]GER05008.1 hypothetical protein JCM17846_26900 [Iodidimonas nitroreducens]
MHRLLIDGAAIAYIDSGNAEGGNAEGAGLAPVLLFIHGWTSDHSTFARQLAHFAPHYRTICVDLPGHGESDPVTGAAYDIAFYTQRLSASSPLWAWRNHLSSPLATALAGFWHWNWPPGPMRPILWRS